MNVRKRNRKEYMKWRARTIAKILLAKKSVYKEILALLRKSASKEEDTPLFSAKEVQALFNIAHSTYYRWIGGGWLNPTLINGRHYYQKEDILALLEKRRYRSRGGLE
ncbi:helix-turn-helix domain-containing protein [Sphingobacterium chuzhouense]|uniref:Helix-turn-helix domain-containing protein n=1 Tax=Sphingobacterium chuzhouense TaxID=1742264 RepID=A0ABR7XXH4_9SPHI|nr:helix-turn-helix domain-containing protein [Sphingobacterium chuzhouense]MBD1423745.1 helix-turn-helix domain-containing protein [Sphingobacterium chuzhouense]